MDVAPDQQDLYDFIDSLGGEENVNVQEVKPVPVEDETVATGVWQTIADAIDNWSRRILDAESLHERSETLRTSIGNSIRRLELDGFLPTFELFNLRTTADKWIRLLHILSSYDIGGNRHISIKKDIISLMLDLYDLHQLNAKTLIHCCAHL